MTYGDCAYYKHETCLKFREATAPESRCSFHVPADLVLYRYACLYRPPTPGAIPECFQVGYDSFCVDPVTGKLSDTGKYCWGWFETTERLSEQEVREYEVILIGERRIRETA